MLRNLSSKQAKKLYGLRKRLVGTALLTVLWVLLSLFALPCKGAEAAPSREEICGAYSISATFIDHKGEVAAHGQGTMTIRMRNNSYTVTYGGEDMANYMHSTFDYNSDTGRASLQYYDDKGKLQSAELTFSGSGNGVTIKGTTGKIKAHNGYFKISGRMTRALPPTPSHKPKPQQKPSTQNQNTNQQKENSEQPKNELEPRFLTELPNSTFSNSLHHSKALSAMLVN